MTKRNLFRRFVGFKIGHHTVKQGINCLFHCDRLISRDSILRIGSDTLVERLINTIMGCDPIGFSILNHQTGKCQPAEIDFLARYVDRFSARNFGKVHSEHQLIRKRNQSTFVKIDRLGNSRRRNFNVCRTVPWLCMARHKIKQHRSKNCGDN